MCTPQGFTPCGFFVYFRGKIWIYNINCVPLLSETLINYRMGKQKFTIELTSEEISMLMAGLNLAALGCYEHNCPDVARKYSSLWSRFFDLQDICHD